MWPVVDEALWFAIIRPIPSQSDILGGGFTYFVFSARKNWEMIQILTSYSHLDIRLQLFITYN